MVTAELKASPQSKPASIVTAPYLLFSAAAVALTIGLLLRLYLLGVNQGHPDISVWMKNSTELVFSGLNLFENNSAYNYTPMIAWTLAPLHAVPIPFHWSGRIVLSLVDLAIACLLPLLLPLAKPLERIAVFALFWCNPGVATTSAWVGQFDNVPTLFFVLALLAATRARRRWMLLALLFALLYKHIVVFAVWFMLVRFYPRPRAALIMIGFVLIFMLSFMPYLDNASAQYYVLNSVFLYSGGTAQYGIRWFTPLAIPLFYVVMLILPMRIRRRPLIDAALIMLIAQFTLSYGLSPNTMILLLALACLQPRWWLIVISAILAFNNLPKINLDLPGLSNGVTAILLFVVMSAVITEKLIDIRRRTKSVVAIAST